jgi:hypothetical protein
MSPAMIAEIAYAAYRTASNEKNVRGDPLPEWFELEPDNQKAWITATNAIRNPRLADLEDRPLAEAFDRLERVIGPIDLIPAKGKTVEILLIERALEKLAENDQKNGVAAA